MIQIQDKRNCCGCSACYNACPKHCISMEYDNEGFLYPKIDTENCVNCGLCEKVCPTINFVKPECDLNRAVVVQNKDRQVLRESTSGGFFTEVAKYVIDKRGVVFGVCLDNNYKVKHICIDSKEELYRFRNSKYVQSNIGDSFSEVKRFLNEGRLVCFSGTPCQVYALTKYLGKKYEYLILVDIVCRAVPSPGVWDKYIMMKEKELGHLKSIRFRDKALGYQYSTMCLISDEGKKQRGGIESDQWLRMFFSGMIIRPSCTNCVFRNPDRVSDFTIWDCYNIHRIEKSFDEDVGTTRVLIHTKKASEMMKEINEGFIYKEIPYETAISGCKELSESPKIHTFREEFFKDYKIMPIDMVLSKYFPNSFAVIIKKISRLILNRVGLDKTVKHLLKKG